MDKPHIEKQELSCAMSCLGLGPGPGSIKERMAKKKWQRNQSSELKNIRKIQGEKKTTMKDIKKWRAAVVDLKVYMYMYKMYVPVGQCGLSQVIHVYVHCIVL